MKRVSFFLIVPLIIISLSAQTQSIPSWKVTDLQKYIAHTDSVLVIDFWATFCKPCIHELPYIQSEAGKLKTKVSVLLVSLDLPETYPAAIDSFSRANNYTAPVVWLNETNADYFCPKIDPAWTGVIPATLFINRRKGYQKLVQEQMDQATFVKELNKAL